jgi:FkbM family methyltransferase
MENTNPDAPFTRAVVAGGALASDPFVVIDVGCGMGIDPLWRVFEPHFHARGLDPQVDEIERLAAAEENPSVRYRATLVGLPDEDEYHRKRREEGWSPYFHPVMRSSGYVAAARELERGRRSLPELNSWQAERLTARKIGLSDFVAGEGLTSVDFVKIDTDGADYEVLLSARTAIHDAEILGFMVETQFNAQPAGAENGLPNVDALLRGEGFLLYTFTVNRYSRAALPAPFSFGVLAQTTFGQVMWGDTVYLRDAGSEAYTEIWGAELPPTKLLKLACLYELFCLPDCAAELLLRHRGVVGGLVDVDRSLDRLTPPLDGKKVPYRDYVASFERDPYGFYPRA